MDKSTKKLKKEKELVLTIGRMNPPTSGHIKLIKQMMVYALKNKVSQVNIILSSTSNDPKNPLPCYLKKQILEGTYCENTDGYYSTQSSILTNIKNNILDEVYIYPNVNEKDVRLLIVNIICGDDPTITKHTNNPITNSLVHLLQDYNQDYIQKVSIFIGDDRKGSYNWITNLIKPSNISTPNKITKTSNSSRVSNRSSNRSLTKSNRSSLSKTSNSYNKSYNKPHKIEYNEVAFVRADDGMSATKIRGFVQTEDWDSFYESYKNTGLNDSCIRKLYDDLSDLLSKQVSKSTIGKKIKDTTKHTEDIRETTPKQTTTRTNRRRTNIVGGEKNDLGIFSFFNDLFTIFA
jgi:hypothetical protein